MYTALSHHEDWIKVSSYKAQYIYPPIHGNDQGALRFNPWPLGNIRTCIVLLCSDIDD